MVSYGPRSLNRLLKKDLIQLRSDGVRVSVEKKTQCDAIWSRPDIFLFRRG